jgi:hypothetical protein
VEVVVLLAGHAAVCRRRRRAALVVGALRRGDDHEALVGAIGVADAEQAGDVAEPQRRVVAHGLDRRQLRERRGEDRRGALQVAHAEGDQRVLGEALQRLEGGLEALVEGDRPLERRRAHGQRVGEVRRRRSQRAHARAQLAEQRLAVGQERPLLREVLDRLVECRGPSGDRVLQERPRDVGQRAERRVEVAEQLGLGRCRRGDDPRAAPERGDEAPEPRLGIGQVLHDRREVHQQRVELLDRAVEVLAAAGEAVAELDEVALPGRPRLVVERVEHLVDLDGHGSRVAQGDRRAVGEALARAALGDLHVLQAERRARADDHRGVVGQRLDGGLELQREDGGDRAVGVLLGRDVGDRADARSADAHVVALDEVGRVGDLGLELVRRHERQAGVGVVGQEDGDDDDERGRRADQHGVGGDRGRAAAAHQPSPPRR